MPDAHCAGLVLVSVFDCEPCGLNPKTCKICKA